MKLRKRTVFIILLAALLALCFGALADSPLGVQTGARYGDIRLTASTDAATVLDYLEDYLSTEMACNMVAAEDLASYSEQIENSRSELSMSGGEHLRAWLAVYDAVPAGGTLTGRELAVNSLREMTAARNELEFFAAKLGEYLVKDAELRARITGGNYTKLEIDQMRDELAIVDREAEKYRQAALEKLTGDMKLTEPVRRARRQLSVFDSQNVYRETVAAIQGLGSYLEHQKADAIARQENEVDPHYIRVLSKKEVGIMLLDPNGVDEQGLPRAVGMKGVKVRMTREGADLKPTTDYQEVTTDEYGLAVFQIANFDPDENRRIHVYVSFEDVQDRDDKSVLFRRKDLGLCHLEGGDDPVKVELAQDNGEPYLVSLLFEELDMTVMNEGMYLTPGDKNEYLIHGEVEMNGHTDQVFRIKATDIGPTAFGETPTGTTLFDVTVKPGGPTTFEVDKKAAQWLSKTPDTGKLSFLSGHQLLVEMGAEPLSAALPGNWETEKLFPNFHYWDSDTSYDFWINEFENEGESSASYLNSFVGPVGIKLPAGIPVVGGAEISMYELIEKLSPDWKKEHSTLAKIKLQLDLPRSLLISYNNNLIDPSKDNEGRIYASKGQRAIEQRHADEAKIATEKESQLKQGFRDQKMASQNGKFAGAFSYGFTSYFQLRATFDMLNVEDDTAVFVADLSVGMIIDLSYDMTFYPITLVYVNFNALMRINVGVSLRLGFEIYRSSKELKHFEWEDVVGYYVSLHVEFTLSMGAGIKGLLSAGVRGAVWIDLSVRISEQTPVPAVEVGARAEVFVEAFVFKWSSVIIECYTQFAPEDKLPQWSPAPSLAMAAPAPVKAAEDNGVPFDPDIPRSDVKFIQTDHTLLAFYVERSVKPNKLMMVTADYLDADGQMYNYRQQVIFTVQEEYDYLYDFDVTYDEWYGISSGATPANKTPGIYFVVTMGNWEGGVDIGGGKTDFWEQDAEKNLQQLYREAYLHQDGATVFGKFELKPGTTDKRPDEQTVEWEYFYPKLDDPKIRVIYNPVIQTSYFGNDDETNSRLDAVYSVVGTVFRDSRYFELYEYNTSIPLIPFITVRFLKFYTGDMDAGETLPDYWVLGDVARLKWITDLAPMILVQHHQNETSSLKLYKSINATATAGDVVVMDIDTGGKTVNQFSQPYRWESMADDGYINSKSTTFLLSDGESAKVTADRSVPGNTGSLSLLVLDVGTKLNYNDFESTVSWKVVDYDLDGCGGEVDMMPMTWQDTVYFYWFATKPSDDNPDVGNLLVRASMMDPERDIISPVFTLAEISPDEAEGKRLYCLRSEDGKETKLIAAYAKDSVYVKAVTVMLKTAPTIDAFAPEYSAVGQGHAFNVLSRIENTGAVVLNEMDYVVRATPKDGGATLLLQSGTINLRYPEQSRVTHLNYLQQDHPELRGKSLKELTEAVKRLNDPRYVTIGEQAVYRLPDNYDPFNGNLLRTVTRTGKDGKTTVTAATEENYFFMPGNIATYKFMIADSSEAIKTWEGEYILSMEMTGERFTMGIGENCPTYEAVLSEDGSRYEYYLLDRNGGRVIPANGEEDGMLALFSPELPARAVQKSKVNAKTGLNTARNDALEHGHIRYLTMEQNDYELSARLYRQNGADCVDFTLRNYAPEIAPGAVPRLVAKALYNGKEQPTGWSVTLPKSDIRDGFTRGITVPLKDIVNGQKYEELSVYLVSTASGDPLDFMDMNTYNNKATLNVSAPLRILRQPQNITVEEGTDAVFTVVPEGADKCSYQWVVCYPDRTRAILPGETGQTLTVRKAQRSQSGYSYCCLVSVPDGRTVRSDWAVLTVTAKVPRTGDTVNPYALAAAALAAAAACAVLAVTLARKRKKV